MRSVYFCEMLYNGIEFKIGKSNRKGERKRMKQTRKHQFGVYVKMSCSVLLMSGTLIGYGLTKDTQADSTETPTHHYQSPNESLSHRIEQAKKDLNQLKSLTKEDLDNYQTRIDKAKDKSNIDKIIEDAKQRNDQLESSNPSTNDDENIDSETTKELDQFLTELNDISDKVDIPQQNRTTDTHKNDEDGRSNHAENANDSIADDGDLSEKTQKNTDDNADDQTIFSKLDKIKEDVNSAESEDQSTSKNTEHKPSNDSKNVSSEDKGHLEKAHSDFDNLKSSINDDTPNVDKKIGTITEHLKGSDKITHALAKAQSQHNDINNYLNQKQTNLNALKKKVDENQKLPERNKEKLNNEIERAQQKLNGQQNIILDQLKNSNDKTQATKNILNSVMSKNEADNALKQIKTNKQSDKQIANQIAKQMDSLATTSSDDILKSMLDQSKDKEKLIKQLMSTRLGQNEASKIAKKLAHSHLSNAQIVNQLKRDFDKKGNATSDDILNGVLNNAKNKKEAIETILATRLNQEKAKMLAEVISRIQNDKSDALKLIQSALNGKVNDLLQLQKQVHKAKNDLDYILSPIKDRPSLLDRIHGNKHHNGQLADLLNQISDLTKGPSLFDRLNSKGSLLDGVNNIDTPTPENGLSLGSGDSLLSGLFNDDGNISLPATGKIVKRSALPIAIVALIIGIMFIWKSRRKHKHTK